MVTSSALATAAITPLIKGIIDDLYSNLKESTSNFLGKSRSEIKDQTVTRSLLSITKVKTLWSIEKEVSLYDFYYPSTIEFSKKITKKINSTQEFGKIGNYIIQGTAGQGKSIFLRFLCGQELKSDISSGKIPIFIELRRISKDQSLNDLILTTLEKFKLPHSKSAWEYLASSGRFILLLDAFDEIDPSLVSKTLGEIENICEIFRDKIQIIVTSRPDADIQKSSFFRVFKLSPLSKSDHAPFLKKICIDKEQATNLLSVLKDSPSDVASLLTTPLMMTLLVILYKSLQTIPDTVPKFYEELFDVLFYRHDHSKPGFRRKRFTQLDDGSVKKLFSALCFFVRLNGLGVLSNQQMEACCEMASKATAINVDFVNFKSELIKTICLMQEEGFEISFIHKSVAQYYAASFVSKSADEFSEKFYQLAHQQKNWELELKFLSQIDSYRFNKEYEIPLLKRASSQIGINIDIPLDTDIERINNYFMSKTYLVIASEDELRDFEKHKAKNIFIGWSAGRQNTATDTDSKNKEGRDAIENFLFMWVYPIFDFLQTNSEKIPANLIQIEKKHKFVPIKIFEEIIKAKSLSGSKNVLSTLNNRYLLAKNIVHTEGRKADMLTEFLISSRVEK